MGPSATRVLDPYRVRKRSGAPSPQGTEAKTESQQEEVNLFVEG
jgi:hypothetical protein